MNHLKTYQHASYAFIFLAMTCGVYDIEASAPLTKKTKSTATKDASPTSPGSKYDFVLHKNNRLALTEEDCQLDLSQKRFAINGRGIFEASKLSSNLTIQAPGMLPKGLGSFISLSKLSLAGCRLREIPDEVCTMTNLTELDISSNPLQRLPKLNLPKLLVLIAAYAELTELHSSLSSLEALERLLLSNNALKVVPEEILQLPRLKHLDCSNNALESLPEDIARLKKLRELFVGQNQLTDLPAGIGALTKLRIFAAEDNKFSVFPKELLKLTKVAQILLNNNQIPLIPEGLQHLFYLEELSMDNNPVTNFPFSPAIRSSLKVISLLGTPIAEILKSARELERKGISLLGQ